MNAEPGHVEAQIKAIANDSDPYMETASLCAWTLLTWEIRLT